MPRRPLALVPASIATVRVPVDDAGMFLTRARMVLSETVPFRHERPRAAIATVPGISGDRFHAVSSVLVRPIAKSNSEMAGTIIAAVVNP